MQTDRIDLMSRLLDVAALRQDVIAQNTANVNTPGYRAQHVSFEDALRQSLAQHAPGRPLNLPTPVIVPGAGGIEREDGNNVDVDMEMTGLQKNGVCFNIYTQILANNLAQFRAAIAGH